MKAYKVLFVLTFLLLILLFAACTTGRAQELPAAESVGVTRSVTTVIPTVSIPDCSPLPQGMEVDIMPLSSKSVRIVITGLQSGEELYLAFDRVGEAAEGLSDMGKEILSTAPIGEDGRYETTETFEPREDGLNHWQMKVVHARGVICEMIELS